MDKQSATASLRLLEEEKERLRQIIHEQNLLSKKHGFGRVTESSYLHDLLLAEFERQAKQDLLREQGKQIA